MVYQGLQILEVIEIVKDFNREEKLVGAICAGPMVLQKAGIVAGKNFTCYPGVEEEIKDGIYRDSSVVVDGNIITAKGPAFAVDFSLIIVEYLLGKEKKDELGKDILLFK